MKKRLASTFVTSVTVSLLLAVFIAGCSSGKASVQSSAGKTASSEGSKETVSAAAETKPVQGGELTFALATSPETLNPLASGFAVSHRVFRNIYDSLVFQDAPGSFQPWLATSWTKSDDGLTYTFKLREDVKFHDGTPFNAEAVKASFDYLLATSKGQARALLGPLAGSKVVDEFTVEAQLSKRFEPFLSGISSGFFGIPSPKALEEHGDQFGKHPVGTGPFKFVKWTENSEIVLEKNPDYNSPPPIAENKGPSYLDKLVFKIIPEEATRIGSVQSGQVLAAETIPPQNIDAVKGDARFKVGQAITNGTAFSLYFNTQSAPWDEVKARQAIQLAIDVDMIVKTLYLGHYERAWSTLTPGILGYNATLENQIQPDLAKANQLLDELGWQTGSDGYRAKDGKKLTLKYLEPSPNREKRNDIAVIVQQQLKEIGVNVELNITKDTSTLISQGDYDLFGNAQVKADPDILTNLLHSERQFTTGGTNWPRLSDPNIDRLLESGYSEPDAEKRKVIYGEIQHYLSDNAITIPIYVFSYTVAQASSVEGLTFDLLGYPLFYDVSITK
ncbi:ABC transporter substrate-binding protein [Paenibacillaceae bacterium]|nr:ABC transporter substrate-binding protein [Paenibacillaceae bacterium]